MTTKKLALHFSIVDEDSPHLFHHAIAASNVTTLQALAAGGDQPWPAVMLSTRVVTTIPLQFVPTKLGDAGAFGIQL